MDKALVKALSRISNYEYRSDRRHRGMVGVEEMERIQRIARTALGTALTRTLLKGEQNATS